MLNYPVCFFRLKSQKVAIIIRGLLLLAWVFVVSACAPGIQQSSDKTEPSNSTIKPY